MKILVHGFGPYMKWHDNITMKVLGHLKDREGLTKKIFDVKFDEEMFLHELRELAPDVVIGMGQHPRARKIRIERTAVNRRRKNMQVLQILLTLPPHLRLFFETCLLPRRFDMIVVT